MTVHRCLQHQAPRYFASYCVPVSEVPGHHHYLSVVVNCLFYVFDATRLEVVFFQSSDQQSGIHCLMIFKIQLLTPNIFGKT